MSPDKKRPIAEDEAPQDAPLTQEEFEAQMQQLTERARADGLKPIKVMAKTYVKQGISILEGFLDSLEAGSSKKKE